MINLPQILNNKRVISSIPTFFTNRNPPLVSYSYTKSIANKIFNFKWITKDLDFDVGTNGMCCNCNQSEFIYTPMGHVITGNLNIIKNDELRQLN